MKVNPHYSDMIRKSQPTPSDVHVDRPLTNISIAFLQEASAFVADQVFPNIPVLKQSDVFFTFPRGFFNRNQMEKRAPTAETKGVGYEIATDNYRADVWGLHHDIPDQRRANADAPLQPDREATELLTHQALIRREIEWASQYFVTGLWTTELTGVSGAPAGGQFQQWNEAGSDPIGDVENCKTLIAESTGFEVNTMVMDRATWAVLRNHPDIIDRIKFSGGVGNNNPAVVNLQTVAAVFDVERIVVARAIQNTALEGATDSHSFILGKNVLLAYATPTPGLMVPTAGYTFSWTGLLGAGPAGQRISRFRLERNKSDRVEIEMAFDQKLISADLGCFLLGSVA